MNKVILIGRLARDPELRTTPNNLSVATFAIAVSRPYNPQLQQQETDFINCVVWRKQAENLAKYCRKGSQIAVEGRIQIRNYTTQDGNKRYVTEVMCESITYLDTKNKGEVADKDVSVQEQDPFASFGEEVQLTDDDLPFMN